MTTLREAAQQALEALELEDMACRYEKDPTPEHIARAITALRAALAEPVQEPCPNCANLQDQNTELDRKLAELEGRA